MKEKDNTKPKKKMKLWVKILLIILAILLVTVIGLGIAGYMMMRDFMSQQQLGGSEASDVTIVETDKGMIRGSLEGDIYQYLGVQYAQATERFTPAQEVEAWDGVRDATEVGPMSPQSAMLGMQGSQEGTDNNCQTINIWTPGINDGGKRAVMVWLHGGGFSSGSANSGEYNGANLSRSGDVVVVGVNSRLGASGFLDLSAYGDKYQYSANVGVDDMVKALEWIHENIEEFGGDPDNVTLFGQSGGGAKVLSLMTTPYAKGLFHRGIVQSGATETLGVTFSTQEMSTKLTERILANLGITVDNIEDIQTIPFSDIESASVQALQETANEFQVPAPLSAGYAMEWGPVVDGDYIPSFPVTEESFAENGKDIELLIGSNLNEWNMMMGNNENEVPAEVTAAFAEAYPDRNPEEAGRVDTLIRLPMLKIMSHKADQNGAKVYAYVFTWSGGFGSYHGAEIPFVFNQTQNDVAAQEFASQVSEAWVNFAKTGVPSAEGLPVWEPYTRESGATMILDSTSKLVYGHDRNLMKALSPDYVY